MPNLSADAFLRAFRRASVDGGALEAIAADADGFAAALAQAPDELALAMTRAGDEGGGAATVSATAFASAACRRDGRIIAADPAFAAFDLPSRDLSRVLGPGDGSAPRLSAIVDDARGRPVALAIAAPARALAWPLSAEVRAALESGSAEYGLLGVGSVDRIDWPQLFAPWTFTGAETRLAGALLRRGDLREAAQDVGVAYETARETLAAAMAKTGARRQPDFVRQLAQLAFGDLPASDATWRTLADTYDLTERQGRLALLVALGATRATAAEALGASDQTAKSDLKVIFERCGATGGAELGRIVAETDALARLAAATDVEILAAGAATPAHPLRFVRRRRGPGRIAVEDHGPRDGRPVVVFHTPTNGRHLPGRLVTAMQALGLRAISVERPGFGLTSSAQGDVRDDANADLIDVLDALGLGRVALLGRSVAMPLAFAAAHPARVDHGVLIASTPPGSRPTEGLMATAINLALNHPGLVAGFARLLVRLSSERAIMSLTERTAAGSPSDLAALQDPMNRADWIRSSRQSAAGDGFAREFVLHADGGSFPQGARAVRWTVLMGGQDHMSEGVVDGLALWKETLPRGTFNAIPNGGRFLHLSHPDRVAQALAGVDPAPRSVSPPQVLRPPARD